MKTQLPIVVIPGTLKHMAFFSGKKFKEKPQGYEPGQLQNYFKRNHNAKSYTVKEMLNEFAEGRSGILAQAVLKPKTKHNAKLIDEMIKEGIYDEKKFLKLQSLQLLSTTVVLLDIDDDYGITDIERTLEYFDGRIAGMYGTFSYGKKSEEGYTKKGHRIIFQLDRPITDKETYREVAKILKEEFLKAYPEFPENNIDIMTGVNVWHGGKNNTLYVNEKAVLNGTILISMAKQRLKEKALELEQRMKRRAGMKYVNGGTIPFDTLLEMAHTIGHIPSGAGMYDIWYKLALAIRAYELEGQITGDQAYELFDIISGGESSEEEYYSQFTPRGSEEGGITIGTFIAYAREKGYQWTSNLTYSTTEVKEEIEVEYIDAYRPKGSKRRYINPQDAKELLKREERLLIESPTGSGKTVAFMQAFKEIMEETSQTFFIFAAHTVLLAEQVAKQNGGILLAGEKKLDYEEVTTHIENGERIFVVVYDKAPQLYYFLENFSNGLAEKIYLVVDEIHSWTGAYNYRFRAIDSLIRVSEAVDSFIGLTGTSEPVLKDTFDKKIIVRGGETKSPNSNTALFLYEKKNEANAVLTNIVKQLKEVDGIRSLIFVNSKKRIERIRKLMENKGLNVKTITSDNKKSITYKNIVENERIDDEIDVVLSTTVMADGVSIQNDPRWSCIVVTDNESMIYDPSTIKQISNRFRKPYDLFMLYAQNSKGEPITDINGIHLKDENGYEVYVRVGEKGTEVISYDDNNKLIKHPLKEIDNGIGEIKLYDENNNVITKKFPLNNKINNYYIHSIYQEKLQSAELYVDKLNEEFSGEYIEQFIPSFIEENYAIYRRRKNYFEPTEIAVDEEDGIITNKHTLRHYALKELERTYAGDIPALTEKVKSMLGRDKQFIRKDLNKDVFKEKGIEEEITIEQNIRKEEKEERKQIKEEFEVLYTKEVHEFLSKEIPKEQAPEIEEFFDNVDKDQLSSARRLATVLPYEHVVKEVQQVTNRNKINRLYDELVSLLELAHMEITRKDNITKQVYLSLKEHMNIKYTNKEHRHLIKTIALEHEVKEKDVKDVLKLFNLKKERTGQTRYTTITEKNIITFAEDNEMEIETVKEALKKIIPQNGKQKQLNYSIAAYEVYGIIPN